MNATMTETRRWAIRPFKLGHGEFAKRVYRAVAIDDASGAFAIVRGRTGNPREFATVAIARDFIARNFDGGRAFPELFMPTRVEDIRVNVLEIERIKSETVYAGLVYSPK